MLLLEILWKGWQSATVKNTRSGMMTVNEFVAWEEAVTSSLIAGEKVTPRISSCSGHQGVTKTFFHSDSSALHPM